MIFGKPQKVGVERKALSSSFHKRLISTFIKKLKNIQVASVEYLIF